MADAPLQLWPEDPTLVQPLFPSDEDYTQFREKYIERVTPELEKWDELRRKSEEESRRRLLR